MPEGVGCRRFVEEASACPAKSVGCEEGLQERDRNAPKCYKIYIELGVLELKNKCIELQIQSFSSISRMSRIFLLLEPGIWISIHFFELLFCAVKKHKIVTVYIHR
jgi:hypothetical protein